MKHSGLFFMLVVPFVLYATICISAETFVCRNNDFKDSVDLYKGDDDG